MKRLLLMLSCLLCLCSCSSNDDYRTGQKATLEELEGTNATLSLTDSSEVVRVKLTDTLDCYLKTPLKAEGQGVMVYNSNRISQVDQKVVSTLYKRSNRSDNSMRDFFLNICFCVIIVGIPIWGFATFDRLSAKISVIFLSVSLCFAWFMLISKYANPQYEIVAYGQIARYDKKPDSDIQNIVIKTETNEQEYYQISFSVLEIPDDKKEEVEGLIYSVKGEYILYPNLYKDRDILEMTTKYINGKNAFIQKFLLYSMLTSLGITIIFIICSLIGRVKDKKSKQARAKQRKNVEKKRAKIEEERLRQEEIRQQEIIRNCEKYVNDFWQDFLDSPEETSVLLARLKLKLEMSGYRNWKEDIYEDVVKTSKKYQRPSQEQRQSSSAEEVDFGDFGDLLIDFNGIFVTPAQYMVLNKYPNSRSLSKEGVLELCRKLSETMAEFASFKEVRDIQPYVKAEETNEAFRLFGLTSETLNAESLKQAYRRLVQKYHPDRNKEPNAVVMFQKVQRYYAYLDGLIKN